MPAREGGRPIREILAEIGEITESEVGAPLPAPSLGRQPVRSGHRQAHRSFSDERVGARGGGAAMEGESLAEREREREKQRGRERECVCEDATTHSGTMRHCICAFVPVKQVNCVAKYLIHAGLVERVHAGEDANLF